MRILTPILSSNSEYDQEQEYAIEKEYWVCYEVSLVLHLETILEEARGCQRWPENDEDTEGYAYGADQTAKDGTDGEKAER